MTYMGDSCWPRDAQGALSRPVWVSDRARSLARENGVERRALHASRQTADDQGIRERERERV